MYKSGYVAVLGRPNAGKSTLINKIVEQKVAIVSPKPQTTRNNILGIYTKENTQIVFIDTPGIHKTRNALDKYMMKNVRTAQSGADVCVYLIDSSKKISSQEIDYIKSLKKNTQAAIIVALTKIDLNKFENVLPLIAKLGEVSEISEIIPLSSKKGKNTDEFVTLVEKYLPQTESFMFDEDDYTDKSTSFLVSEIVREKALYNLNEEIPHGISVVIANFEEKKNLTVIDADIICEKQSHKSIIIGKNAEMIKKIGESARLDIENLLGCKVLLKIFVKTKKNWRESVNFVNEFGYKFD